jgi:hypothetical protein
VQDRTIWIDVDDFFTYFEGNPRPSGIQRLAFKVFSVLPARAQLTSDTPRIAFVRHADDSSLLREVPLEAIREVFELHSEAYVGGSSIKPSKIRAVHQPRRHLRLALIRRIESLPCWVARPLLRAGVSQLNAFRAAKSLLVTITKLLTSGVRGTTTPPSPPRLEDGFDGNAGDVLLVIGAPWTRREYGELLNQICTKYKLMPVLLLYDLIPLRRPEWCSAELVRNFRDWLQTVLPLCS